MINNYVKHRGRVFIRKTFQLKIILRFLVILAFGGVVSGLVLYFFASNELETKLYQAHMNIINTLDILLPIIIITSFSVFLLLSLITIYTVLYLSHRIAGPLYKFETIAEEIERGNLTVKVQLRKKDELLPLKTAIEKMLSSLQDKIRSLKSNYKKIKGVEDTLQSVIRDSSLPDAEKKSLEATVNEFISVYEENISSFKVDET
jgi:methyl-accepting chemotaxis protein